MPDGSQQLQQGIISAGQSIAGGIATGIQARRQAQLQRVQEGFRKAKERMDLGFELYKIAKSEPAQREIFNTYIGPSIGIMTGQNKPLRIDVLDDPTRDAVNIMTKLVERGGTSALIKNFHLLQSIASEATNMQEALETIQTAAKPFMPTGTPQRVQVGLKEEFMQPTGVGTFIPVRREGEVVSQPSQEVMNRVTQFRKEFNNDEVVKGMRKALADADRINNLIDANIPGSAGPIITQRAKASGEQRITDQDVERFAGSKATADQIKRFLVRIRTGKLSKTDQRHFKEFNDIVVKKMQDQLQTRLNTFINSVTPQLPGVPEEQVRTMVGGLALTAEGQFTPLQDLGTLTPESDLSNLSREELEKIIRGEF